MTDPDRQRAADALALASHGAAEALRGLNQLPPPHLLAQLMRPALGAWYLEQLQARGEVFMPEDTFPTHRSLAIAAEVLGEYAAAFKAAAAEVRHFQVDELANTVGTGEPCKADPDGVAPLKRLKVPDAQGDLLLTPQWENPVSIDLDQLVETAVQVAVNDSSGGGQESDASHRYAAREAVTTVLALGSFTPQVTKVTAWAERLSRTGDDKMASVVNSAVTRDRRYKGVKIERKEPKK